VIKLDYTAFYSYSEWFEAEKQELYLVLINFLIMIKIINFKIILIYTLYTNESIIGNWFPNCQPKNQTMKNQNFNHHKNQKVKGADNNYQNSFYDELRQQIRNASGCNPPFLSLTVRKQTSKLAYLFPAIKCNLCNIIYLLAKMVTTIFNATEKQPLRIADEQIANLSRF
jgi:hypothetical protein